MANERVTVATFTYPPQAAILKGRLESEGIECFLKDELTTQVNPFYSNAIGGVKLQVWQEDAPQAIALLKEWGYPVDDGDKGFEECATKMVRYTQKIPLINKYPIEKRYTILLLILALVLTFIITFIYFVSNG